MDLDNVLIKKRKSSTNPINIFGALSSGLDLTELTCEQNYEHRVTDARGPSSQGRRKAGSPQLSQPDLLPQESLS